MIPAYITYRRELNEAEQENISRGRDWALARRRDVLNDKFTKALHRHMLGDLWRWAGKSRTGEKNLDFAAARPPHLAHEGRASVRPEAGNRTTRLWKTL